MSLGVLRLGEAGWVSKGSADIVKGFGVTARSTAEARRLEPTGITTFRQADIGEYLREVFHTFPSLLVMRLTVLQEDTLFAT